MNDNDFDIRTIRPGRPPGQPPVPMAVASGVPMTDQQTSRTNITEALRDALADQALYIEDDDGNEVAYDAVAERLADALAAEPRSDAVTAPDLIDHEAARREALDTAWPQLREERRSDAVTAPEEPSTLDEAKQRNVAEFLEREAALKRDHPERLALADALGDMLQYEYPDKYAMGFALLSRLASQGVVVREARAASASVPPLDVERLARAIHPEGLGPVVDCCHGSIFRDLYPDDADERHRAHHLQQARDLIAAYAAETPEQGRGDE